mgnify:CR=1 FL=1
MPSERDKIMSEKNSSNKNVSGIAAGITMAASVLPLVKPAIDAVRDYADKTIEERKKLIAVPELYSKEYPLTIEQAVAILESCGLKATLVKAALSDADMKYRTCFDTQVIKSHPKAKQKVERGSSVLVKYVTQEVIEESQRLYELSEQHKAETQEAKLIKQTERKEKTKQMMTDMMDTAKRGVQKIPVFKKKENEDAPRNDEQE